MDKKIDWSQLSTEELEVMENEIKTVLSERRRKQEYIKALALEINGITSADVVVLCDPPIPEEDEGEVSYSFCIGRKGKLYDICYEHGKYDTNHNYIPHPWWPWRRLDGKPIENLKDDLVFWNDNGAYDFIPPGFDESSENSYWFSGSPDEALNTLKKYGINTVLQADGKKSWAKLYTEAIQK